MPDQLAPSEFGGKTQKNRIQRHPHRPTPSEMLMLGYTTGDPTGASDPDNGEAFQGLLPFNEQKRLREQAGDLKKGEVWDEILRDTD